MPIRRGPDYPLRCVRKPRVGSSRRFLGLVCSSPPKHASDPQPRYRARETDSAARPCARTALPGRCSAAAEIAPDSGHGIPSDKGRRIHRRLLLARLPRALRPAEDQPGILVGEGTPEHGTRPGHRPAAQGSGMARTPLLGARAIRCLRKQDHGGSDYAPGGELTPFLTQAAPSALNQERKPPPLLRPSHNP